MKYLKLLNRASKTILLLFLMFIVSFSARANNTNDYSDWVTLTYKVEDTSLPTQIFFKEMFGLNFDIANITDMVVLEKCALDTKEPQVVIPDYQYTFSTIGEHTVYIKFADMTKVPKTAFNFCVQLISVILPDCVSEIEELAFNGCVCLTEIKLSNNVRMIGKYAFMGCSRLSEIILGDNIKTIQTGTFYECTELKSIVIPKSVKTIENRAFSKCSGLTSMTISNSVTTIGECSFEYCRNLKSLTIPNSVQTIGKSAFYQCRGLTSITIGLGVKSIGKWAFAECVALKNITSLAVKAPDIFDNTFKNTKYQGNLFIQSNSIGYDAWLSKLSEWTMQDITEE